MGCIYLLYDDKGNGYIGKTKNIKQRIRTHKHKTNRGRSRYLDNFEYLVIEEFDDEDDLDNAEQFYYDLYKDLYGDKLVNGERPLQTRIEYRRANRKHLCNTEKQRYYNKREMINKKIDCECGGRYSIGHKERHFKSKLHTGTRKESIMCICGGRYVENNKCKHIKTLLHTTFIQVNQLE